eukprot:s5469_g1.t1
MASASDGKARWEANNGDEEKTKAVVRAAIDGSTLDMNALMQDTMAYAGRSLEAMPQDTFVFTDEWYGSLSKPRCGGVHFTPVTLMPSPSNKIDTARQGSPESFDSLDLRGENILVDPSVVGFDRLAVLRPQKPRLPSDDPDQPTAYFLPPVLPKKAVAQRESPAGHNGARNKAAVTYVTTKAKDGSPMEDQYSLTHTDSMDRVDLGEAKDRQLSAQSELLQLHLKAVAKPQLQLARPLFHSTTTDMGSEDGGIHLEASEAFRRILESLLQQHVRELNDLASIGAAGTRSRGTEPKLKSNPTSPNSVFSRVTKEMDKCVSDNVDSILASTGLRLFQARNILDVLDGDQQELFEKPKGQRVSRMSSDFLPELFEDSEEQRNSYKALPWCHRARIWFQSAGYEMVIALVLCVNVLWMAFELQLYGAQTGGTLAIQEAPLNLGL